MMLWSTGGPRFRPCEGSCGGFAQVVLYGSCQAGMLAGCEKAIVDAAIDKCIESVADQGQQDCKRQNPRSKLCYCDAVVPEPPPGETRKGLHIKHLSRAQIKTTGAKPFDGWIHAPGTGDWGEKEITVIVTYECTASGKCGGVTGLGY